jgi:hypothetical protein
MKAIPNSARRAQFRPGACVVTNYAVTTDEGGCPIVAPQGRVVLPYRSRIEYDTRMTAKGERIVANNERIDRELKKARTQALRAANRAAKRAVRG